METQEFQVLIQLTLNVDINKTKEDVKNLVNAYIINEKCEHIDVMMKDIIEIENKSEIYQMKSSFILCASCHRFKMRLKQKDCYIDFKIHDYDI